MELRIPEVRERVERIVRRIFEGQAVDWERLRLRYTRLTWQLRLSLIAYRVLCIRT